MRLSSTLFILQTGRIPDRPVYDGSLASLLRYTAFRRNDFAGDPITDQGGTIPLERVYWPNRAKVAGGLLTS